VAVLPLCESKVASGDLTPRSAGTLLDDAAAHALRQWIYRPATLNGRSVRVLLTVTVNFRVH